MCTILRGRIRELLNSATTRHGPDPGPAPRSISLPASITGRSSWETPLPVLRLHHCVSSRIARSRVSSGSSPAAIVAQDRTRHHPADDPYPADCPDTTQFVTLNFVPRVRTADPCSSGAGAVWHHHTAPPAPMKPLQSTEKREATP